VIFSGTSKDLSKVNIWSNNRNWVLKFVASYALNDQGLSVTNGELNIFNPMDILAKNISETRGTAVTFQSDGNLIVYRGYYGTSQTTVVFASGTNGRGVLPFRLKMQDDKQVAMYDSKDQPQWDSNSALTSQNYYGDLRNQKCKWSLSVSRRTSLQQDYNYEFNFYLEPIRNEENNYHIIGIVGKFYTINSKYARNGPDMDFGSHAGGGPSRFSCSGYNCDNRVICSARGSFEDACWLTDDGVYIGSDHFYRKSSNGEYYESGFSDSKLLFQDFEKDLSGCKY